MTDPLTAAGLTIDDQLDLLRHGTIELEGRLIDASNTTLRGEISLTGVTGHVVYKPIRGERPLWDFPDGTLAGREVAAYLVARAGGWNCVPPTVLRDGPLGPGSCQLWLDETDAPAVDFLPAGAVPDDWLPILDARDEAGNPYVLAHADTPQLAALAALDVVMNNADRKGGHVLTVADRAYGIDHGLCFHADAKLRTVLWGWAGRPLPTAAGTALATLAKAIDADLATQLAALLTSAEVAAMRHRLAALQAARSFPMPPGDRPAVPWPPI